jgi:hypothetical protein
MFCAYSTIRPCWSTGVTRPLDAAIEITLGGVVGLVASVILWML